MFCGAAGEALNPAEHPFNNLSALRAQIWTEPNLKNLSLPQNDFARPLIYSVLTRRAKSLKSLV
jgi:hypothetical protein